MIADKAHTEMREAGIDKTSATDSGVPGFRISLQDVSGGLYIVFGLTGQVDNPDCILLHIEGVTFADFDVA